MSEKGPSGDGVEGRGPPLVSVIVPTCDRPELLVRALSSILGQTHPRMEVIVVDDASRTDIAPVIARFQDERIRLIRHDVRQGPSASRNDGIAQAKGDYISFLDDDDEWFPEKIGAQLDDLATKGGRFKACYCQGEIYNDIQGTASTYGWKGHDGDHLDQLIAGHIRPPTVCFMIARECLQKVGGFRQDLGSMEDRELWIRLAEHYQFAFLDRVLFRAHVRHGPRVSQDYQARFDAHKIIYRAHRDLLWGHRKAWSEFFRNYGFELLDHGYRRASIFQFIRSILTDPIGRDPYVALYLGITKKVQTPM